MTYVITQSCCNDASCILECPVDCIRPTPGDPDFVNAEMLYIDPDSCIDCGACQDACPVDAIYTEEELPSHLRHFTEFNAGYFFRHPLAASIHSSDRPERPVAERGVLRVAIVGSGPSAAYLAEDLLERGNVQVDVIDKLPTPWGLLRSGVAPDHLSTKKLTSIFDRAFRSEAFRYHLNVEVGRDITVEELQGSHHAVVLATGAADPAPWDVPGADLSGVHPATAFVAWYNGHPDHAEATFDLSCERAVVIGNGNVALDVARILLLGPEDLAASDIAEHARLALSQSKVREVVVAGRRGPVDAAYTFAEFHALAHLPGVEVVIDTGGAEFDPSAATTYEQGLKASLTAELADAKPTGADRRVVFRYRADTAEVVGKGRVEAVRFKRDGLVEETGLVLTSIGYRGRAIPGVPFDDSRGTILHDQGRVMRGLYVVGWAKRGAQGGIGAGRPDAHETAAAIVADFNNGVLTCDGTDLGTMLAEKQLPVVTAEGWAAIDTHERHAGATAGRPRVKLVHLEDLVRVGTA